MELQYILFAITTLSTFFNGFSLRKKSVLGVLATSLSVQIPLILDIITKGIPRYEKMIVNTSTNAYMSAIIYVFIVWIAGYIVGGINLTKKNFSDDLPGKDVKRLGFDLDNK